MSHVFAVADFLDSDKLHGSVALVGAAAGFWAGTKLRNVSGETGLPGGLAVVGAVLFYLLAAYLAALALFIAAVLLLVLLIKSWPTIARIMVTFAEKLSSAFPSFQSRSFHKRLASEQRRHENELEHTRGLATDPDTKQQLIEKLGADHRHHLIELADRHQSRRP